MAQLRGGHQVRLLVGGQEFFPALVRAMDAAQTEIRLETYIFHTDRSGEMVLQAMERAALRGIAVFLIVDGIGTPELPPDWVARLDAAGIRWRRYAPLGSFGWLMPGRWRRLHRKLCVVDRCHGFCGGINILDDYLELHDGWQSTPRLDFALEVDGPLVEQIWHAMEQFWRRQVSMQALEHGHLREARAQLHQPAAASSRHASTTYNSQLPGVSAALVLRDNVLHRTRIERTYRRAIAHARSEIIIANPYFIPGAKLIRALIHAAQRGVRVQLLLSGRYEFFMQFHAGKPFYPRLLAAGIDIHEYEYGYLHAKVAVIDGHWSTVGSSNLDPLSLLLAREANVVVDDHVFAQGLRRYLIQAIHSSSVQVKASSLGRRNWVARVQDWVAYRLMRLSLLLVGKNY